MMRMAFFAMAGDGDMPHPWEQLEMPMQVRNQADGKDQSSPKGQAESHSLQIPPGQMHRQSTAGSLHFLAPLNPVLCLRL